MLTITRASHDAHELGAWTWTGLCLAFACRMEALVPMRGMDHITFLVAVVIVTALVFDFTNGFHDTANAMATSIATGALQPKVAVAHLRRPQRGRRVPVDRGRQDDLRRHRRRRPGHPGDDLRAAWSARSCGTC